MAKTKLSKRTMISPNDFGNSNLVEGCQKININNLVRQVNKDLKLSLIKSRLELSGIKVNLLTSKTRFDGERLWFSCPNCLKRMGVLCQDQVGNIGCRECLGLKYAKVDSGV